MRIEERAVERNDYETLKQKCASFQKLACDKGRYVNTLKSENEELKIQVQSLISKNEEVLQQAELDKSESSELHIQQLHNLEKEIEDKMRKEKVLEVEQVKIENEISVKQMNELFNQEIIQLNATIAELSNQKALLQAKISDCKEFSCGNFLKEKQQANTKDECAKISTEIHPEQTYFKETDLVLPEALVTMQESIPNVIVEDTNEACSVQETRTLSFSGVVESTKSFAGEKFCTAQRADNQEPFSGVNAVLPKLSPRSYSLDEVVQQWTPRERIVSGDECLSCRHVNVAVK